MSTNDHSSHRLKSPDAKRKKNPVKMDCQQTKKVNRSGSDHSMLASRSGGRKQPEKPPAVARATRSVCNLSKLAVPKTRNKFPVTNRDTRVSKQPFPVPIPTVSPTEVPVPKKFLLEKSLTMIEMGSPSRKPNGSEPCEVQDRQEQTLPQHSSLEDLALAGGRACSTTALPRDGRLDRMVSHSNKLIYQTGFKLLLKCNRDKKREIHRLNTRLCRKENDVSKFSQKFETIQSLYQTECRNHEKARSDIRLLKQKVESLKANLLEEKTAHLAKVSELEESLVQRGQLQSQLKSVEDELAKAIICWHNFECTSKLHEERYLQLEGDKRELLKQIDNLEDNFKNFERDYEKMLADHVNSSNTYEARLGRNQKMLDKVNSQLEVYETDCQLLKEWNVRLAADLAQIKESYHSTYSYRVRRFVTGLPRNPGFYLQYALYLLVQGVPLPKKPSPSSRETFRPLNIARF